MHHPCVRCSEALGPSSPLTTFADLNTLHLLMAGHFKHLHAKVADITSIFPNLTRLSLRRTMCRRLSSLMSRAMFTIRNRAPFWTPGPIGATGAGSRREGKGWC